MTHKMNRIKQWMLMLCATALVACTGVPEGVTPVRPFELSRYLGVWHEQARLDHRFERGLTQVSATYELRSDGGVRVINRGWDAQDAAWRSVEGRAYFIGDPHVASLKVSFFGPFYGAYHVIALDDAYQVALVTSYSKDYFWILSRASKLDAEQIKQAVTQAAALGFAVDQLIDAQPSSLDQP